MTTSRKISSVLLFVLLPILLAYLVYNRLGREHPTGTEYLKPKVLESYNSSLGGKSLSQFKGKALWVFFGFLSCPDVCPTTLQKLAKAYNNLEPSIQGNTQVLLISVDPKRDTQAAINKYTQAFNPSFAGLVGSESELAPIAKSFAVYYQNGTANVEHTSSVFGLDKNGRLRVMVNDEILQDSAAMTKNMAWLSRQ